MHTYMYIYICLHVYTDAHLYLYLHFNTEKEEYFLTLIVYIHDPVYVLARHILTL